MCIQIPLWRRSTISHRPSRTPTTSGCSAATAADQTRCQSLQPGEAGTVAPDTTMVSAGSRSQPRSVWVNCVSTPQPDRELAPSPKAMVVATESPKSMNRTGWWP